MAKIENQIQDHVLRRQFLIIFSFVNFPSALVTVTGNAKKVNKNCTIYFLLLYCACFVLLKKKVKSFIMIKL